MVRFWYIRKWSARVQKLFQWEIDDIQNADLNNRSALIQIASQWTQKYDQELHKEYLVLCYDERKQIIATPLNSNTFTDFVLKKQKFCLEKVKKRKRPKIVFFKSYRFSNGSGQTCPYLTCSSPYLTYGTQCDCARSVLLSDGESRTEQQHSHK